MENWKVELTTGSEILAEVKIQRDIFQGHALLPLVFVIAMMPLNYILRMCTGCYKLLRSQEKFET